MLKKLLKYDFRFVFKYWWIAAATTLALSVVGSGCINIFRSSRELPGVIYAMAVLAMIIIVLSFAVFATLAIVMIFARFYKNFFTDEGYLTFTLPVKRSELLNSKLILSTATMLITGIMIMVNTLVMFVLGFADKVFTKEFFDELFQIIREIFEQIGFYTVVYILEAIVLLILSTLFSNLFLYCCITLGSIITKKAKVITSIGIYYAANMMFTGAVQIFSMFGLTNLFNRFSLLPRNSIEPMVALLLLGMILFFAVLCALLYTLQYWMLDRKLNLS